MEVNRIVCVSLALMTPSHLMYATHLFIKVAMS